MTTMSCNLGPVLFNWPEDTWRDFYFRIADEAPIDTVYLGEVICAKRAPFYEPLYAEVTERLRAGGKRVVYSTLAEVMLPREREMVRGICEMANVMVEANDASALYFLRGRPHCVGPFVNVYNENTLSVLAARGARHVTLGVEISRDVLPALATRAGELGVSLEVQAYGRMSLALSARCYHARAHGRVKDNCQFVCAADADGMDLRTHDGQDFLVVNGIQTLSHRCLNLVGALDALDAMGIAACRLSPHSHDMVRVAGLFRAVLDRRVSVDDANEALREAAPAMSFADGFFGHLPGCAWGGDRVA